jgi:hypothetical protein
MNTLVAGRDFVFFVFFPSLFVESLFIVFSLSQTYFSYKITRTPSIHKLYWTHVDYDYIMKC